MPSFTASAGGYHTTPEEEELLWLAMLVETGLLDDEQTESVEITLQIYGDFTPEEIEEVLAIAAAGISIPDASKKEIRRACSQHRGLTSKPALNTQACR